MPGAYWVMTFRSVSDPAGLARYAAASLPVIRAHGGRVLAAGVPAYTYEAGLHERVAIVEFSSLGAANDAYRSPEYQAAVRHLAGAAERDVRIVEAQP